MSFLNKIIQHPRFAVIENSPEKQQNCSVVDQNPVVDSAYPKTSIVFEMDYRNRY